MQRYDRVVGLQMRTDAASLLDVGHADRRSETAWGHIETAVIDPSHCYQIIAKTTLAKKKYIYIYLLFNITWKFVLKLLGPLYFRQSEN